MPGRRPSLSLLRLAPLGLGLLLLRAPAQAREEPPRPAPTPDKNFSFIHAHSEWVEARLGEARQAGLDGEWGRAVRALQELVDQTVSRENPADAAPYVVPVQGSAVYEGAWIHARLALAALPPAGREAYAREWGPSAESLLAQGLARRDPVRLREVATRFLALDEGRRAALLLADLALEAGDPDRALGWLEQLEDLDAASEAPDETLAPWIAARHRRVAVALGAHGAEAEAVTAVLRAADRRDASQVAEAHDALARRGLGATPPPTDWLTSGGDRTRAARAAALGADLTLRWVLPPLPDGGLADQEDPRRDEPDRPSAWLPPRAVAYGDLVFVNDGERLHVMEAVTGRYAVAPALTAFPQARPGGIGEDTDVDRRRRFGLLEGHALTIVPGAAGDGAALVLAAVPDGAAFPTDEQPEELAARQDHVQAFRFDGTALEPSWSAGGPMGAALGPGPAVPADARLYGAPLYYAGKVWVAGIRPSQATTDRWDAWLYALAPTDGRLVLQVHLGTGTPVRRGRVDEVIPTSPAAARGRVVVGTALGIAAAVDADDGRPHWVYRYNRAVETERGNRRVSNAPDESDRPVTFLNEPPVIDGGRVFLLPTDGEQFIVLFDRPLGRERLMRAFDGRMTHRTWSFSNFAAEHLAGVRPGGHGDGPLLYFVGQTQGRDPPGPLVVAREAFTLADRWARPAATGFGARPYGRALLTRGEVLVPLPEGIAVHDAAGGDLLGLLDPSRIAPEDRPYAPPRPYGNLIPVPGRGLLSVSATTVAFWALSNAPTEPGSGR